VAIRTDLAEPRAGAGAMAACTVSRMQTTTIRKLLTGCILAVAFAGCATDDVAVPETEAQTSSAVSCTPGAETCDYGCNFDGAQWNGPTPTTDDCIIRCNAAGNAWTLVTNCGWAQNFPYSSSCLNSQPHPICQNN
jgi:hypothetical protein